MKKFMALCLCIISFCFMCGCNSDASTKQPETNVVINMPTDETVNGYRIPENEMPDKISAETVLPDGEDVSIEYCGNKNSKKFHKAGCSSLKSTKAENKVFYKTKEDFLNKGYTPCKKCNP